MVCRLVGGRALELAVLNHISTEMTDFPISLSKPGSNMVAFAEPRTQVMDLHGYFSKINGDNHNDLTDVSFGKSYYKWTIFLLIS